jgi:isopenicillin-N epimerase
LPLGSNLRTQWALGELTFLNHGSFGAVPRAVLAVQSDWRARIEADPIEIIGRRREGLLEGAKRPVGERFGMRPDDFGFVTNATEGVNAVLRSLDLRPGDELLTTNHVYHAVRQTMKLAARRVGATCREVQVPLPATSNQALADAVVGGLSDRTRLVVIDHVTSPTALVFPVGEIVRRCRARGVDVLIDGAHAPGMLPLDVTSLGAAYYAANLHKWCLCPKGTAFIWTSPAHQADVHPTVISHGLDSGYAKEFDWQGTRDLSAWLSAPAALAFLGEFGWDAVLAHNHAMAAWAHRMLVDRWHVEPVTPLDGSLLGSMATVRLPGRLATLDGAAMAALQQRLHDEYRVEVPLIDWPGGAMLRVSCQLYNTPADYERLGDVIAGLAG